MQDGDSEGNDNGHYIVDAEFIDGVLSRASSVSNNALYALVGSVAAFLAVITTLFVSYSDSPSKNDHSVLVSEQKACRERQESLQGQIFELKSRVHVIERSAGIERPEKSPWGERLRTKSIRDTRE